MSTLTFDPSSEALLKRRAELLAKQPTAEESGDTAEVLICRLGSERYAIETASLRAVQWVSGIVPVPCTPSYVAGIVSVRGEIVTLLHLGTMLGLSPVAAPTDGPVAALLLGLPELRAGLVVDEVLDVERLNLSTLQPSISGRDYARGVAPGQIVVLDVAALFASGRFTIDEG
jgi:purine-binding chemotaxis protein CheW